MDIKHTITYNHLVNEKEIELNVKATLLVMSVALPTKVCVITPTSEMELQINEY